MPRTIDEQTSPENVYDDLLTRGTYTETESDPAELKAAFARYLEDYAFAKSLRALPNPNYRVIFSANYAALRNLCGLMLRTEKMVSETDQGIFIFLILQCKELDFDWLSLEGLRMTHQGLVAEGKDVSRETWKRFELQIDLYVGALRSEIEKRLGR